MNRMCRGLFAAIVLFSTAASFADPNAPGTLKWLLPLPIQYSSPAIGSDGTIYVGAETCPGLDDSRLPGGLYAINPNGSVKWRYDTLGRPGGGTQMLSPPAIAGDGTIYVWSLLHDSPLPGETDTTFAVLHAVRPDGSEKWRCSVDQGYVIVPALAIGRDGTVYVGASDTSVYAIDPLGQVQWHVKLAVGDPAVPSVVVATDGTIYASAAVTGSVYALKADGTVKWSYAAPEGEALGGIALGSDGAIYVGHGWSVMALNSNGTLRWMLPVDGCVRSSPAISADGTVYVHVSGDSYQVLVAISPEGIRSWDASIDTRNSFLQYSSPTIAADGTIYICGGGFTFSAVNPDGTSKWSLAAPIACTSPAIGQDGTIYLGSFYGLVALSGSSPLANTPWPTASGGSNRRGLATPPGDIDGNGCVDVVDLLHLAGSWGTAFGQEGFDPRCDLNNDGGIDVIDLMLLATAWGK